MSKHIYFSIITEAEESVVTGILEKSGFVYKENPIFLMQTFLSRDIPAGVESNLPTDLNELTRYKNSFRRVVLNPKTLIYIGDTDILDLLEMRSLKKRNFLERSSEKALEVFNALTSKKYKAHLYREESDRTTIPVRTRLEEIAENIST